MDQIAKQLGYANSRSAYVMAHRWGLHTMRPESNQNSKKRKRIQPAT
jgi:hypothetical protein